MNILIPGGAGYIGSHMVRYAQELGHEVVVLDNFSTGHRWAVKDCEIICVDLLDQDSLSRLLNKRYFDGVIHFAAKSLVGESINNPSLYYENNVVGTLNLVNEMLKNDINNIVFSSTAAIYGNPIANKINEDHPKNPINPYGKSKLFVEGILKDLCSAYKFNSTCLRYFNAAGADLSGEIGEAHDPETHLIPNILKSVISNKSVLKVFGNDYPTPDGTCIRDYIHVKDIAIAHILGLNKGISENSGFSAYNLGNGSGFSVLDVIKAAEEVANVKISYEILKKRGGDPSILVADSAKAKIDLKWQPSYKDLNTIIQSAWDWHKIYEDKKYEL